MTIQTSTLRPGLLVSLKTSVTGNVRYQKRIIEGEHKTETGETRAKWETERVVINADELERAKKARSKARALITATCAGSAFGLLCPEADAGLLETALLDARKIADEFNATAELTRISVYVLTGRIAADDVEAVKAIKSEVAELIGLMETGVSGLDVQKIRDAADRAKELSMMLTPDAEARVTVAIETARKTARAIVKAGETAAAEVDQRTLRILREQRTAFLDLDDAREVAAPVAEGRAVDLTPEQEIGPTRRAKARAVELE